MTSNRLPHSLVLATAKGGVGKTTISANLAAVAAARDGRWWWSTSTLRATWVRTSVSTTTTRARAARRGFGWFPTAIISHRTPRPVADPGRRSHRPSPGERRSRQTAHHALPGSRSRDRGGPGHHRHSTVGGVAASRRGATGSPAGCSSLPAATARAWPGIPTMLARVVAAPPSQRVQPVGIVLFDVPARATAIVAETRQQLQEQLGGHSPYLR